MNNFTITELNYLKKNKLNITKHVYRYFHDIRNLEGRIRSGNEYSYFPARTAPTLEGPRV